MATTTGPRTISRSATRQIAELREQLTTCTVYTLDNNFHGRALDPKYAWEALDRSKSARLIAATDGSYTVHVHDNHWYELRTS